MGAARAVKALRADDLVPDDEETRLQFLLDAVYRRVLLEVHYLVRDSLPVNPATFRLRDEDTEAILREAATRVVGITETTRAAIADVLAQGQREGWTTQEIADGIAHLFDVTWKSRPFTVASTEIAEAQRLAAINRYTASGLVDRVKISDATRGKDHTDTCLARAGTTVPLDEAPPLDHPNCLVGETLVLAPDVLASSARWFDGEVVVIRTARNDLLTVTPNHPVLSGRGWVAAGSLSEGDHVFRCGDLQRLAMLFGPDSDDRPSPVEQIARTLGPSGVSATTTMPTAAEDFHGDGTDDDVAVIRTNRFLERWDAASIGQQPGEPAFSLRGVGLYPLPRESRTFQGIKARMLSRARGVGVEGERATIGVGHASEAQAGGLAAVADRVAAPLPGGEQVPNVVPYIDSDGDSGFTSEVAVIQSPIDLIASALYGDSPWAYLEAHTTEREAQRFGINANHVRDLCKAAALLVEPSRITQVLRRPFRGHVYNLQTQAGWYVAENILTHNCSLVLIPVLREGVV